jgi:hypothetical protein
MEELAGLGQQWTSTIAFMAAGFGFPGVRRLKRTTQVASRWTNNFPMLCSGRFGPLPVQLPVASAGGLFSCGLNCTVAAFWAAVFEIALFPALLEYEPAPGAFCGLVGALLAALLAHQARDIK